MGSNQRALRAACRGLFEALEVRRLMAGDPPVAVDDAYAATEDVVLTVDAIAGVLANDTDTEADLLTAVLVTPATNGTVVLNPDGSFTYTPNPDFNGADTFTYLANDGTSDSATAATVTITIAAVNDAGPVAVDDADATTEDTPLVVLAPGVLGNDTDADIDALTAVLVAQPANGVVVLNPDGSYTYTPNADFNAIDSFTYRANDGTVDGNIAIVTITVAAAPDAPAANPDNYSTGVDAVLTVPAVTGVLANDTDVENDAMTAAVVANPANGAVTLNDDGSFTYTPNSGFNGADSFTYNVSDAGGTGNTATVTILVNDNPVATDDTGSTPEETPLVVAAPGVLVNDTDANPGATLTATLVGSPANGGVVLNGDGSFTYTPNANFAGTDTFTYRVGDGFGQSNLATVTITVTPVNDAPDSVDDAYSTSEDGSLQVTSAAGVLDNDTDPDAGATLSAILVTGPSNGTLTLNNDGSFTYTPNADFAGTDTFTYKSNDGTVDGDVATATITVNAVNDVPDSVDDSFTTAEDTPLTVAAPGVLGNDTDVESDALTAVVVSQPAHGTLTLNADGSFTYTPDANFNGSDSFTYRATDAGQGDVATVTITVTAVPDAPIAAADNYTTGVDDVLTVPTVPIDAGVLANDTDPDGGATLTAALVTGAANGVVMLAADGSFTYMPNSGFRGTDTFAYEVSDGTLTGNAATVTIIVDDAPVGVADAYNATEETPLVIAAAAGVLGNDSDPNSDPITAVIATQPAGGAVVLNADGSFTYTPNANFSGVDTFTYRVDDGLRQSAPVTVTITVADTQDPPVANDDSYSVNEDGVLTRTAGTGGTGVLGNDTDPDINPTLTVTLGVGPTNGTLTLNADGSFTYTPNANFNGADSFTYTLSDGTASDTATVNITVDAVNDVPDSVDDGYTATEETTLTVPANTGVLANDTDLEGNALTAVVVIPPAHGTLTLNADGSFSYTPAANFVGTDTFTYRASDAGQGDVATVTITVINTNDAPTAINDAYATTVGVPLTVNALNGVLKNDTDPDPGFALTAAIVEQPINGTLTLNANGSFTYTPSSTFAGLDQFIYKVNDGTVDGGTATVTITVTGFPVPPNVAPTAENVTVLRNPGSSIRVSLGDRVNDADGDDLTITIQTQPRHGSAVVNQRGTASTSDDYVEYVPNPGYYGEDSFVYKVDDGNGGTDTARVTVKSRTIGMSPNVNGKTDLIVVGGAGRDVLRLVRTANGIRVVRNGIVVGTFRPTGSVIVKSGGGNDTINAAGLNRTAFLYGGAGNDRLIGGGRLNYLYGGDGDDEIVRGTPRDVVVAGKGKNTVR